jgi:hypothetical protein
MFRPLSCDHLQGLITVLVQYFTYWRASLVIFRCVAVCYLCVVRVMYRTVWCLVMYCTIFIFQI